MDELTTDSFRARMTHDIKSFNTRKDFDPAMWDNLCERLYYIPGKFGDEPTLRQAARNGRASSTSQYQAGGNLLFYLATPPSVFGLISANLEKAGFKKMPGWKRIIVEKPFGTDLPSAAATEPADSLLLGREPDLPRRSLPRQGDGAEHPGVPLLQRHVRAALEQAAHRSHPDDRVRIGQRRRPRRLLRSAPACCAT